MRLFARIAEIRRLARENRELRAENARLRRERDDASLELRSEARLWAEHNMLMLDRFLTSQAKTWPVTQEAKENTARRERTNADSDRQRKEIEDEYLSSELRLILQDAADAGIPANKAREDFSRMEPMLLENFQKRLGFE